MIRSFACKETERIFNGIRSRTLQTVERTAYRKLAQLDSAASLNDLRSPGNALEALIGDRDGQHSIRVNDQFRLCFEWKDGEVYHAEIVDYH